MVEWTESSYQDFPQSCQTIKRWLDEILAYFDNRTTQGLVEGINQKIKLIKRRAYGLTNFDNFKRRVLLTHELKSAFIQALSEAEVPRQSNQTRQRAKGAGRKPRKRNGGGQADLHTSLLQVLSHF